MLSQPNKLQNIDFFPKPFVGAWILNNKVTKSISF